MDADLDLATMSLILVGEPPERFGSSDRLEARQLSAALPSAEKQARSKVAPIPSARKSQGGSSSYATESCGVLDASLSTMVSPSFAR